MTVSDASSVTAPTAAFAAWQARQLGATTAGAGLPRNLSSLPQADQVKAVSTQFEAILLRQFLQESIGNIMGGDKGGPTGNVYGYLLTDTLAAKISEGGGLGLSKILQQQLTPHDTAATTPATTTPPPHPTP